jgi:heat shock protein HspQ
MDVGTSPLAGFLTGQKHETELTNRWIIGRIVIAGLCARAEKPLSTVSERSAKFAIGQIVRHRIYPFRGVIFDVDPVFGNTEEWYQSIPAEIRPTKDQPFYHLLAQNESTEYVAYVSEQNLLVDTSDEPMRHPQIDEMFERETSGAFKPKSAGKLN